MAALQKNPTANQSKYPTRKDWTTHLHQYYSIKANKAKLQSMKFEKLDATAETKQ